MSLFSVYNLIGETSTASQYDNSDIAESNENMETERDNEVEVMIAIEVDIEVDIENIPIIVQPKIDTIADHNVAVEDFDAAMNS